MSTQLSMRAVLGRSITSGSVKRAFTTSPCRPQAEQRISGGGASASSRTWSGGSVLAVAVAAGAIGFGVAAAKKQGDIKRPLSSQLLADKEADARYASIPEMEAVSFAFGYASL